MGSDVFYRCDTAERAQVERLVGVIERYARDHSLPCRVIDVRNSRLIESGPWEWPRDLDLEIKTTRLARRMAAIAGGTEAEPISVSDIECLAADRNEKRRYFEGCQQAIDLYGIAFPSLFSQTPDDEPELASRGQLVFDFRADGILVNCAIDPKWDRASDANIPCPFLRVGGYWRSVGDYLAFPRFLTLCRIRYLPRLDFSSDYDEKRNVMGELEEHPGCLDELRESSDEEFYEGWLKGRNIIG